MGRRLKYGAWMIAMAVGVGCSFEPVQLPDRRCDGELTLDSPEDSEVFPSIAPLSGQCAAGVPVALSGDIAPIPPAECREGTWSAEVRLVGRDGAKEVGAAQQMPGCVASESVTVVKGLCVGAIYDATPYAGTGLVDDPFIICNDTQLRAMADNKDQLGLAFALGADIDLTGVDWQPIGDLTVPFQGAFDGRDLTISGLQGEYTHSYVGIFGATEGAEISNLRLTDIHFVGDSQVGALGGIMVDTSVDKIVLTNSRIEGYSDVGGLVGSARQLTLKKVVTESVSVSGETGAIGGVVGLFESGLAETFFIDWVTVIAGGYGGGAFGNTAADLISIQVSNAAVSCTATGCGGIVGLLQGGGSASSVSLMGMCYGQPCVSGVSDVGGLIGHLAGDLSASSVNLSPSPSAITGEAKRIGGAVGFLEAGAVEDCTSNASVNAPLASEVGGLVGMNQAVVARSGASGDVTGLGAVGGLIGALGRDTISGAVAYVSRASGAVRAEEGAGGGLVGVLETDQGISDCYATGSVSVAPGFAQNPATQTGFGIGGIVGVRWTGAIERCLYTGLLVDGDVIAGALLGEGSDAALVASFFRADVEVTSVYSLDQVTALTGPQMDSDSMFIDSGWDFSQTWVMGTAHPILRWELP